MFGIRDRPLGLLVGLMFAPFALQLLGWLGTPLGGGPCGELGPGQMMLDLPGKFFYAQIMLWGISLLLATGFFIVMISLMHPQGIPRAHVKPFLQLGLAISLIVALIYTLTRTWGLPAPSPLGLLWTGGEPIDAIGILILLVLVGNSVLIARWLYQNPPPVLANSDR